MSYVARVKNFTTARKISINFRENGLFQILQHTAEFMFFYLQIYTESSEPNLEMLCLCLNETVAILEKCLSYDYTAIQLNETDD